MSYMVQPHKSTMEKKMPRKRGREYCEEGRQIKIIIDCDPRSGAASGSGEEILPTPTIASDNSEQSNVYDYDEMITSYDEMITSLKYTIRCIEGWTDSRPSHDSPFNNENFNPQNYHDLNPDGFYPDGFNPDMDYSD